MTLLTAGYVGLFAVSVLAAITSPLVFDSGGTARNWSAFVAFIIYPFFILSCIALAWVGFRFRRTGWIATGFLLPIAYAVAFWFAFS